MRQAEVVLVISVSLSPVETRDIFIYLTTLFRHIALLSAHRYVEITLYQGLLFDTTKTHILLTDLLIFNTCFISFVILCILFYALKRQDRDFPGGPVVKKLPACVEDTGSVSGLDPEDPHTGLPSPASVGSVPTKRTRHRENPVRYKEEPHLPNQKKAVHSS